MRGFYNRGVSIHAPVRGATSEELGLPPGMGRFNPRAREGRDCQPRWSAPRHRRFNPRAREGRDLFDEADEVHVSVFQSTRP